MVLRWVGGGALSNLMIKSWSFSRLVTLSGGLHKCFYVGIAPPSLRRHKKN